MAGSARDPLTGNSGVTYPRSTAQVIFQDGMIWGGRVKDGNQQELRVGGQTYEIGTVPGVIESKGVAQDRDTARLYRIRRDWATADLRLDASEVLNMGLSEVTDAHEEAVRAQYERDWMEWPAELGAPFYDNDGDGQYDPSVDEPGFGQRRPGNLVCDKRFGPGVHNQSLRLVAHRLGSSGHALGLWRAPTPWAT